MTEAAEAAHHWGATPVRLLGDRENKVWEMTLPSGDRAVLRLHRPGYQGDEGIRAELAWVAALAERGLPVAAPLASVTGDLLVALPSGRRASAVGWVEGVPLGRAREPLPGTPAEQAARFRALGALLRRLHLTTDALTLPVPFARPDWGVDGLTGEAPVWGRFWDHPEATPAQAATLRAARAALRDRLSRWQAEGADLGPIHADALRENVLVADAAPDPASGEAPPSPPVGEGWGGGAPGPTSGPDARPDGGPRLSLIDFDDSGTGFRLYDLGVALAQNLTEPAYPALRDALCAGYGGADPAVVEWFTLARCCASVGWTMPRLAPGDPIHASHIARATGLAERLL